MTFKGNLTYSMHPFIKNYRKMVAPIFVKMARGAVFTTINFLFRQMGEHNKIECLSLENLFSPR
jgi:hypothetical protein